MIKLDTQDYLQAVPVFKQMDNHLAVSAVLHGSARGSVYTDSAETPTSALIIVRYRLYLAGNAYNTTFLQDLRRLFQDVIFPQAKAAGQEGFVLEYEDSSWEPAIQNEIFKDCTLYAHARQYYELDLNKDDLSSAPPLPAGLDLRRVDRSLLDALDAGGREALIEEMMSERESVDDFLDHSFGFSIVDGKRLVTWCLSEYNDGLRCEIGIATAEAYRRRGLATITAKAFLEHARAAGHQRIGWHCWTNNIPSAASALRLGFKKVSDTSSFFVPVS